MRKIVLYILVAMAAMGCSTRIADNGQATGTLQIQGLTIESATDTPLGQSAVKGRAIDLSNHILEVVIESEDGTIVERYTDHTQMPSTVVLRTGAYTITAKTADINSQMPLDRKVGFDQPQYYAQSAFTVEPSKIVTVDLVCKQASAGVTISYSDMFQTIFPCLNEGETYFTNVFSSHGATIRFEKGQTSQAHFFVATEDMKLFYSVGIKTRNKAGELIEKSGDTVAFPSVASPVRRGCLYNLRVEVLAGN